MKPIRESAHLDWEGNHMKPKTETKYTPTPWQMEKIGYGYTISTVDDREDMHKSICTTYLGNDRHKDSFEDEANAEFIVRAVNSHEALLNLLKRSLERMRLINGVVSGGKCVHKDESKCANHALMAEMENFLAQAEGK